MQFTRRYGPLVLSRSNEKLLVPIDGVKDRQKLLQTTWRDGISEFSEEGAKASRTIDSWLPIKLSPWKRECLVTSFALWPYTCFLFRDDFFHRRTHVCTNPNCLTPYFIKSRRDQTFCSVECRNLVNVQRWRGTRRNIKGAPCGVGFEC
jgi:hypothetical protein